MATWVITGGNRGIGKEFINQLLLKNHTVITGVRNPEQMDVNHEPKQLEVYRIQPGSVGADQLLHLRPNDQIWAHRRTRKVPSACGIKKT